MCVLDHVTVEGMRVLRGLPLTRLDLGYHEDLWELNELDGHLLELRGLPLTDLNLEYRGTISDRGLAALRGMPLVKLNLTECVLITEVGLKCLKGMPLTWLDLSLCQGVTVAGMAVLEGLPLIELILFGCKNIEDGTLDCCQLGICLWKPSTFLRSKECQMQVLKCFLQSARSRS